LFFDLHSDSLEIEAHLLKDIDGDTLAQLDQPEKQMLRAHVIVVEAIGLLAGEGQDLLRAWCEVIHHVCLSDPRARRALRTSRQPQQDLGMRFNVWLIFSSRKMREQL
jgi:hypothetical protein